MELYRSLHKKINCEQRWSKKVSNLLTTVKDAIEEYRELLTELKEMGDKADPDLEDEVQEGIRFDGIPFKSLTAAIAKQIGTAVLTRFELLTLEAVAQLKALSFANCKLSSLENLPNLPQLVKVG